jgi:very-short-patch-repair endonuclease
MPRKKGFKHTEETKANMRHSHNMQEGHHAWNKGLTKEIDIRVMQISLTLTGTHASDEARNKIRIAHTGMKMPTRSAEHCHKMALVRFANPLSIESRNKGANTLKESYRSGRIQSWSKGLTKDIDTRVLSISNKQKELWKNPEHAKKCLHRRTPSGPERSFISLCEEKSLSYRYVGNGQLIIDGKNPDFVDSTGKKLIEIWGDFYKVGQNPQDRIDFFKVRGYQCIVIRASELKDKEKVVSRIRQLEAMEVT